ncbi:hypothetical protein [uncultured Draconibacterium sp.]|uniref:hypothetical protein n=1 Tax=uncultured Draconibacterium sp. TaxID=1573823 RepID=UPI0025D2DD57|nr:hypothetical protein [uncultured Draconibacterium sp.]
MMKEINKTNYEAYFIDYLEGNLDKGMIDSFLEFLKQHPELKKELELYEPISIATENVSFKQKTALYKNKFDAAETFDNAAIALLENDISESEKKAFENYLATHPEKKQQAAAFRKTKLIADDSVVFTPKKRLYKKAPGRIVLLWAGRVAAVLILALALFNLQKRNEKPEIVAKKQVAVIEKQPVEKGNHPTETAPGTEKQSAIAHTTQTMAAKQVEKIGYIKPVQKPVIERKETQAGDSELLAIRATLFVPNKLNTINASVSTNKPEATLATMYLSYPTENPNDEWLLADRVKNKFNLGNISKAGLNLISSISDDRFEYETNDNGKVVNYTYESRLLAFSIPNKKVNSQ